MDTCRYIVFTTCLSLEAVSTIISSFAAAGLAVEIWDRNFLGTNNVENRKLVSDLVQYSILWKESFVLEEALTRTRRL